MSVIEIQPLPTAENAALLLHPDDDVAIARVALAAGQRIQLVGRNIETRQFIPAGHKVALRKKHAGDTVLRYGQPIGRAGTSIEPGDHVHVHNLQYEEREQEYQYPSGDLSEVQLSAEPNVWEGFLRADGRAGTRNYIGVVAASNCAAYTAQLIQRSYEDAVLPPGVDGVVAFPHGDGCGQTTGADTDQLRRTLSGVLNHPNIAAAVILGLGCEVNQIDHYLGPDAPRGANLVGMTLQGSGGTRATVEAARKEIGRLLEEAAGQKRVALPASKIVVGLNCGGSDSFSGITANPALGACSDTLISRGGTVVLAETSECFGAEHLLVSRSRNREVAEKFLGCIESYRRYLRQFDGRTFDDNPSPGNKDGGLTNILEKSLGAMAKAGSTPLMDVFEYAETLRGRGFLFMNTPGYDPVSLTGLAAGGANLLAFTTGRGSAIGFPSIPVLKIASNTATFRRMPDNMDINAGRIADGTATVESVGQEIYEALLRIASGEQTSSERMGHKEFAPWRIGPVM